ncbi:hypothetical protein [Phenylobacterium sp.]|jgi:uncharacterized protein YdcH (DUF465 family)|nr:hypothetical protein [Phenylobacterium sp.]
MRIFPRLEAGLETVADEVLEDAKKLRVTMKDEIAAALARV